MNTVEFTVAGEPVAWHVYSRADNNPRSKRYESKARLEAYQDRIRIAARAAMRGLPPHEGPVELTAEFYRGFPDWAPKRATSRALWAKKHIIKRPDRTNYLKGAEDAMNGIVFLDDSQIVGGPPTKAYSEEARSVFRVRLL